MYTLEWISPEQEKKVMEYLSLLKNEDIVEVRGASQKVFVKELLRLLSIIEAFDNCPKKAAAAFYAAKKNAADAMDRVYELMLAHIPKPTHEHFYAAFATVEEADAFREKVGEEAMKAYREVITKEFHEVYLKHQWEQLDNIKTLH